MPAQAVGQNCLDKSHASLYKKTPVTRESPLNLIGLETGGVVVGGTEGVCPRARGLRV